MSFPCKESVIYFEHLARRQTSLADGSSVGLHFADFDREGARRELRGLMECFGHRRTTGAGGITIQVVIPIEIDEGMEHAYQMTIHTVTGQMARGGGYIQIDFERIVRPCRRQAA